MWVNMGGGVGLSEILGIKVTLGKHYLRYEELNGILYNYNSDTWYYVKHTSVKYDPKETTKHLTKNKICK